MISITGWATVEDKKYVETLYVNDQLQGLFEWDSKNANFRQIIGTGDFKEQSANCRKTKLMIRRDIHSRIRHDFPRRATNFRIRWEVSTDNVPLTI